MDEATITSKAQAIADYLDGVDILDAVDIVGEAITIAAQKNNNMCMLDVYLIGKMLIHTCGKRGIIELTDDGGISFTIEADNGNELLKV